MAKLRLKLNSKSGESAVAQIYTQLKDAISTGKLKTGDNLPTRESIMEQTKVSHGVVWNVIKRLKSEGLVSSSRGSGVKVGKESASGSTDRPSKNATKIKATKKSSRKVAKVAKRATKAAKKSSSKKSTKAANKKKSPSVAKSAVKRSSKKKSNRK
jgi:DNA-binding FadR family transcriptional regulator